jgi:hypothetical protein
LPICPGGTGGVEEPFPLLPNFAYKKLRELRLERCDLR